MSPKGKPKTKVFKCYVCGKYIREDRAVNIGNGVYRHSRCYPGSERWLKSEVGKKSKYYDLFLNSKKEGSKYATDKDKDR